MVNHETRTYGSFRRVGFRSRFSPAIRSLRAKLRDDEKGETVKGLARYSSERKRSAGEPRERAPEQRPGENARGTRPALTERAIVPRLETENTGEILLANAMEQPYVRRAIRLWLCYTIR